ncbi:MAG: dTMP kinase [Mariprofundaceae bacterium]|nr:dTMP kinase [Mariprofundaceae bacterium]
MNHFISFEGIDGCGKSTQLQLTAQWLRQKGHQVLTTRQPGGTDLGKEIRHLLLDERFSPIPETELLLFLADRTEHVKRVIQPALQRGEWVLCDRYTDSTFAYQLAARPLAEQDLLPLLHFAQLGYEPSQTMWLDLDVEQAMLRTQQREEQQNRLDKEKQSFHAAVLKGFQQRAQSHPQRMQRIDANGDSQTVQQRIRDLLI